MIQHVEGNTVHITDSGIYAPSWPSRRRSVARFLPPRSWATVAVIIALVVGTVLALSGVRVPQL